MVMWVMSDRAIPRSFRMMEGFGVHTFRFVNAAGQVALRQVPLEAAARRALAGLGRGAEDRRQGPRLPPARPLGGDRERRRSPSTSSACRSIEEEDEHKFDFDLLDATKLMPEELVPVRRIGKLTLNRNPDNFFAETEQVAFHVGNVVPGIDFTNDPLLQGRLFSYLDTQLIRLGGPNFARDPDQPPGRAGPQPPARRPHAPAPSTPAASATSPTRSAAAARSRPAPTPAAS